MYNTVGDFETVTNNKYSLKP